VSSVVVDDVVVVAVVVVAVGFTRTSRSPTLPSVRTISSWSVPPSTATRVKWKAASA
jgi:hypothetical protein